MAWLRLHTIAVGDIFHCLRPHKETTRMLATIGTVENFIITPSPILDDSEQGYHLEERLQVTLKSAIDEQPLVIEFHLGNSSTAPSEQVLATWLVEDELVAALCTGISARPIAQQRRAAQDDEQATRMDTMVVLAGHSMVALSEGIDLREAVKSVRTAHKRAQRDYLLRRNAERVEQLKARLPERVQRLRSRQGAPVPEDADMAVETPPNEPRRSPDLVEQIRAQLPERIRQFTDRRVAQSGEGDAFTAADANHNGRLH
jgi:hypothetical protein